MAAKERLRRLIDQLPERELADAERVLEALRAHHADPLARKLLTAPGDEEPETEGERSAVAEARAALVRGDVVRDEDLDREREA
ncbi:MAG TPA: hypothetical protein VFC93_12505 [Chloroflexota bacterium]|nr:hypothetical protein [Chloroflexota bacterium]